MNPALTKMFIEHPLQRNAGFTLIEVIVSLVVAGIFASIAGMGIVSAINGYAVVRENVSLSQKIELAATRIQSELLELTDIDDRDDTRPYIVYYSAAGQRQAIAKIDDTIRLYTEPPEISDTYLENNGDILTDNVGSFILNYYQGANSWTGTNIRELSTIEFSLDLFRTEVSGSSVNLTTRVHLRNNDNYGGSAATQAVSPPSADQYGCFISTAGSGPTGAGILRSRLFVGWSLVLILLLGTACRWVPPAEKGHSVRGVLCPFRGGGKLVSFRSFRKSGFYPKNDGSALVGLIITILFFAALGSAIVPMIGSSQLHRTVAGRSAQAYYLAESGLRYAASQYLHAAGETAQFTALDNLHGRTHRLQANQGMFTVSVNPYYFTVEGEHTNTPTLNTHIYGQLASGYSIPDAGGRLSIDDTIYSFSSDSIIGQQITFTLSASLTVLAGTPVYPVAEALVQTLEDGGALSLSTGSGEMFPDRNGSFVLRGETFTYRENNRHLNTLEGIKRTDGSAFSDIDLIANQDIRLKKFVKISSTGAVGSGDWMVSRDIIYHVQIPEEMDPRRIVFEEPFDNLDKWNASTLGVHEIAELGGNNVLRVTGVTQSGVDTPSASLIALNTDAVQFNPDRFDVQVKIGYLETSPPPLHGYDPSPVPRYYSAGLCFRLTGDGNTYGLSFQRGNTSASPPDNIENDLIPADDVHTIVLWQATNNGDEKRWLATTKISDVRLASSSQEISENQWSSATDGSYSIPITDLTEVPVLPCDYQTVKLEFSTDCNPILSDCTTLAVTIDDGLNWMVAQGNNVDLTAFAGNPIDRLRFRINTAGFGWTIEDIHFTADDFDVGNATLLARFIETSSATFAAGGTTPIDAGDKIIGMTSGASAGVYGSPVLQGGTWADADATGTLLLDDVNGVFQTNEQLRVPGKSELATLTGFNAQGHFIKAYYGTQYGCGIPNTDPLDGEKGPAPIDPADLNWPPDEGDPWTEEKDNFTLIQWDVVNSGATGIDSKQTVIQIDNPLTTLASTLGLHTFGNGSLNVYFDDFGYQTYVDQPVAISQPIQY